MKNILIVVAIIVLGLGAYWYMTKESKVVEEDMTMNENEMENDAEGKLKADTFSGTLEEVNTGCFADAECYVVVDGKHVTVLMGWSRDTVGSVQGVDGIGGLETEIGKRVEVYAQDKGDGTYTLYGSEGFYVKPL